MEIDPKFELFKLVISDYGMDDAKKYELCKEIFLSSRTAVMPISVPFPNDPIVTDPVRPVKPAEIPLRPTITYASNTTEDKQGDSKINK